MSFIKTPNKGMRDILPKDMELREYVLKVMKETYLLFGFQMIQTPVVEHIENLTSNQGGENEKLIFKVMKRGEKLKEGNILELDSLVDCGLRYDLTVPLTRFYANSMNELSMPFRSFQIGNVYRAERSQKGRYREFMQCDLDILGEKTSLAEIDLMLAVITFLKKLDFKGFTIKVNDRRILTKMIECAGLPLSSLSSILIALDKLDKIGILGVEEELNMLSLEKDNVKKYLSFFEKNTDSIEEFCQSFSMDVDVVSNLCEIIQVVKSNIDVNIIFDPTLVRGMGYYTGTIFEIVVDDFSSSIGGGGRYDKMIEKYTNQSVSACGFSIGFERLLLLLEERGFKVPDKKEKLAIVLSKDANLQEVFLKAQKLRQKNKQVKLVYRSKNYRFQKESLENENYEILEW